MPNIRKFGFNPKVLSTGLFRSMIGGPPSDLGHKGGRSPQNFAPTSKILQKERLFFLKTA